MQIELKAGVVVLHLTPTRPSPPPPPLAKSTDLSLSVVIIVLVHRAGNYNFVVPFSLSSLSSLVPLIIIKVKLNALVLAFRRGEISNESGSGLLQLIVDD